MESVHPIHTEHRCLCGHRPPALSGESLAIPAIDRTLLPSCHAVYCYTQHVSTAAFARTSRTSSSSAESSLRICTLYTTSPHPFRRLLPCFFHKAAGFTLCPAAPITGGRTEARKKRLHLCNRSSQLFTLSFYHFDFHFCSPSFHAIFTAFSHLFHGNLAIFNRFCTE